jgi:membrane-bound metal-dependent hydrolase YbcI (DUF457 family)
VVITRRLRHPIAPAAALIGAALGAWSHVVLDGVMHRDLRPLGPWSDGNPLLGAISLGWLHGLCAIAGAIGAALWLARRRHPRPEA